MLTRRLFFVFFSSAGSRKKVKKDVRLAFFTFRHPIFYRKKSFLRAISSIAISQESACKSIFPPVLFTAGILSPEMFFTCYCHRQ